MLKSSYYGTYHYMSPKHLGRYVNEIAGRSNDRHLDTIGLMSNSVKEMDYVLLRFKDLVVKK